MSPRIENPERGWGVFVLANKFSGFFFFTFEKKWGPFLNF